MFYDKEISTIQEDGKRVCLIALAIPLLLEGIFTLLNGTINTVILSGYSDSAVSATGVALQLYNFLIALLGMISKGAVIVSSVALGAQNKTWTKSIAGTGAILTVAFSLLLAVVLNVFSFALMKLMGLSGQLQDMAASYTRVIGMGLPIAALLSYINNLLICNGYSRITMLSGLLNNGVNLLLCYLALYGGMALPVSGVVAVAICSCFAQLLALGLSVFFFCKNRCPFQFSFRTKDAGDILKFGVPANMNMVSYTLSGTVTTGFITGLGVTAINTKLYVNNILSYTTRGSMALGNAGGILMGRHRGAGRIDAVKRLYRQNLRLALLCNGFLAMVVIIFHKPILSVFTNDAEIIRSALMLLIIDYIVELARAVNHISEFAFNANGEVKTPLLTAMASAWLCNVPLAWLLVSVLDWGLVGLWTAIIADECFKATVYLLRWRTGKWQNVKL